MLPLHALNPTSIIVLRVGNMLPLLIQHVSVLIIRWLSGICRTT